MSEGKKRLNHKGHYIVDRSQIGGAAEEPEIKFVTPIAQDIELAKSELKDNRNARINGKTKVNKRVSTANNFASSKKSRFSKDVFSDRKQ